ncbi:hypothetical protein GE107_09660 [Cohnella sp. CFH 77786]|uniref:TVP38/TMEM64 family protein n=1 Tax=Cohnella sp. CFH 77786 TaxID=2662265 RepID=UPI001C608D88|nr:VTT domain-containing protein [Cohnella sp. CFH 77786]MBW5446324.1 hypothetical protein [Cohnella sp. CFH 77786]
MKKWMALLVYVLLAIALWIYQEQLYAWLRRDAGSWSGELPVIGAAFLVALIPAIPYGAAAVMLGAKYGAAAGSLLNVGVSVSAAAVLFLVVRNVLTAEQRRKASGMKGVRRLTDWFEKSPFFAVLLARMIPVVPAQAVNIYAALTRMNVLPYLAATLLGKLPFLLAATLLGDQLTAASGWRNAIVTAGAYAVFLALAAMIYRVKRIRNGKRAAIPDGQERDYG